MTGLEIFVLFSYHATKVENFKTSDHLRCCSPGSSHCQLSLKLWESFQTHLPSSTLNPYPPSTVHPPHSYKSCLYKVYIMAHYSDSYLSQDFPLQLEDWYSHIRLLNLPDLLSQLTHNLLLVLSIPVPSTFFVSLEHIKPGSFLGLCPYCSSCYLLFSQIFAWLPTSLYVDPNFHLLERL